MASSISWAYVLSKSPLYAQLFGTHPPRICTDMCSHLYTYLDARAEEARDFSECSYLVVTLLPILPVSMCVTTLVPISLKRQVLYVFFPSDKCFSSFDRALWAVPV